MSIICPHCQTALDLTLTVAREAPTPGRSDSFVVDLVGGGLSTVREVAAAVAGRRPNRAEIERTRRQLDRLVVAGRLRVQNEPSGGGRPLGVYAVAG
jgi:hypothetical protein